MPAGRIGASGLVLKWLSRKRNIRRAAIAAASVAAVLFPDAALPTILITFALVNVLD